MYSCQSGSSFTQGNLARIRLGGTSQDFYAPGRWVRLERNLQADLAAMYPDSTLARITGVELATEGIATTIYMDDLRFSNSITIEKSVLAGGSIGHILRNRTIDPATYAATDKWFHYDQVGSVMAVSNSAGNLQARVHQDAFGNVLADWTTGLWKSDVDSAGWHHNTKEFNGDTGLTYMYQRWYLPETGTFLSKAPYPPMREHNYTFVRQSPALYIDPWGRRWWLPIRDPLPGVTPVFQCFTDLQEGVSPVQTYVEDTANMVQDHVNQQGGGAVDVPVGTGTAFTEAVVESAKAAADPKGAIVDYGAGVIGDEVAEHYGDGAGKAAECVLKHGVSGTDEFGEIIGIPDEVENEQVDTQ
jgi:RHS repeat-associated protein